MFSLPIPFLTAALSALMLVRVSAASVGNGRFRFWLALLFAAIMLQATLVGLRFGYGFDGAILVQRVLPLSVGPLAYLAFRSLVAEGGGGGSREAVRHLGPALVAAAAGFAIPPPYPAVDILIAASFAFYIALLARLWRRGPAAFEAVPFGSEGEARNWLAAVIAAMAVVGVTDVAIAADFTVYGGRHAATIIGAVSLGAVGLLLAAAMLFPRSVGRPVAAVPADAPGDRPAPKDVAEPSSGAPSPPDAEETALLAALDALMRERRLYRDADLTLARLARRLGVPARRLSMAINRRHGMSVSLYVNALRVEEAAEALAGSDRAVGDIMAEAGFRTKSNFNRAFQERHGMSPTAYRAARRGEPAG